MKLRVLFSILVVFLISIKVNSQNSNRLLRSDNSVYSSSFNENGNTHSTLTCVDCQKERSLEETNTTNEDGSQDTTGSSGIGDIISDHITSLYGDLVENAKDQATNTWNSLSSGAKAGIIIAVIVVAIIIIAGIVHCLCICKLCCCC